MQNAPSNPLDLPEIRLILAAYLNKTDLSVCSLVCKSWCRIFRPSLFSTLLLYPAEKDIFFDPLSCTFLPYVLDIGISPSAPLHGLYLTFPNLSSLSVVALKTEFDFISVDFLATFIQRHQMSLECLQLYSPYAYPRGLWNSLAEPLLFPKLSELVVVDPEGSAGVCPGELAAAAIWRACARFNSLCLINVNFPLRDVSWPVFSHLVSLSLSGLRGLTIPQFMAWFTNCPQLQSFSWTVSEYDFRSLANTGNQIVEGISLLALSGHLSSLHSVRLNFQPFDAYVDSMPTTHSAINLLISLKVPLQALEIEYVQDMDAAIFLPVLQCHFSTLTYLNINMDSSSIVQTFMASCPLLETFKGNKVRALDMMGGTPWSCLRLQDFQLMIELNPEMEGHPGMTRNDQQKFVLSQICRLTRISRIDFSGRLSYGEQELLRRNSCELERHEHRYNLNLRLSEGLDLLSTLWRLEYVTLPSGQDWDEREFNWALQHWPFLVHIWETYSVWGRPPYMQESHKLTSKLSEWSTMLRERAQ